MKKFFTRVEEAFKKLFGSTKWEATTIAVLNYIGPLLEALVSLSAGTSAAATVTTVVNSIKADLATISAVVEGAAGGPTPANELQAVRNAADSIKANLAKLLAAADVKNSAKISAITATVTLIDGEIDEIAGNAPAAIAIPTAVPAKA